MLGPALFAMFSAGFRKVKIFQGQPIAVKQGNADRLKEFAIKNMPLYPAISNYRPYQVAAKLQR